MKIRVLDEVALLTMLPELEKLRTPVADATSIVAALAPLKLIVNKRFVDADEEPL